MPESVDWVDAIGKLGFPVFISLAMVWVGWKGVVPLIQRLIEGHLALVNKLTDNLSKLTEVVGDINRKVDDNGEALRRVEEALRK